MKKKILLFAIMALGFFTSADALNDYEYFELTGYSYTLMVRHLGSGLGSDVRLTRMKLTSPPKQLAVKTLTVSEAEELIADIKYWQQYIAEFGAIVGYYEVIGHNLCGEYLYEHR
ncbi:MAG: hypothetical protein LBF08_00040 [Dysgonamonadaceae bacterium]|jgi:hypothetical protein|nr:hypothetical protein [Dysgonamonadaceae bacterium]